MTTPKDHTATQGASDIRKLVDAAMAVIGQHDAWARQMPAGEFDDPLSDVINILHDATQRVGIAQDIAAGGVSESSEPLGRFGHHPDPAIDFCVEIEAIEAEIADLKAGLEPTMALQDRIDEAICFRVGGDARAVAAKNALRAALAQRQPADPQAPSQEARSAAINSLNKLIADYLHDYELDDGEHCPYAPNDGESLLIADAVHGLLADDEFTEKFNAWQDLVRMSPDRKARQQEALTDEQINELDTFSLNWFAPQGSASVREFARAIERKHGIGTAATPGAHPEDQRRDGDFT